MSASHIAVCTDLSDASRRAFPPAASIARAFSARLSLVHLAERPGVPAFASHGIGPPNLPAELASYFESLETRLGDLIRTDSTFDGIDAHARLLRNTGFESLTEFLKEEDVSLLVLTTHGYTGAKRFVFGSFASKVMHSAQCPVLVLREGASEVSAEDSFGADTEGTVPKRIFVATDLTPRSDPAFDLACSWARRFDSRVLVHFVVEKPTGIVAYPKFMLEGWWDHERQLRDESGQKLTKLLAENAEGLDARYIVTSGEPAEEILREIDDFRADLVILGTHGRSGFENFMLGSVVQKVIGRARCSALIVRPPPDATEG